MSASTRRMLMVALAALLAFTLVPLAAQAQMSETLSTGIGSDNRQPHPEYPLKLVFASSKGPYLAQIQVRIFDTAGDRVVEAFSPGPWLFVDLPAGSYRVRAERPNGDATAAEFTVGGDGQTVVNLSWPAG